MVLLTTIMMIMLMSLLIISLMQSMILYQKTSIQLVEKFKIMHDLEDVVLSIPKNACLGKASTPNQMIQSLRQHKGCLSNKNGQNYEYLVADLGVYPCLQVYSQGHVRASHHWLLSILNAKYPHSILQIRLSLVSNSESTCESRHPRMVPLGIISWSARG